MLFQKVVEKITSSIRRKKMRHDYKKAFSNKFVIEPYYSADYSNESDIDLIAITFNAPKLVEYQIKFVKKFVEGRFLHIICDNSTSKECAEEIRAICEKYDVTYIRIEDRKTPYGYSNSHEIALNWTYKNVVKKRRNNFAFIDHDMFPLKPVNPYEYIKDYPVFGKYMVSPSGIWYLWAGFSFFNYDFVKDLPLNFHRYKKFGIFSMKGKNWVDTGSANYNCLYSKIERDKLLPFREKFVDFLTGERTQYGVGNFSHLLDEGKWFHIFDGGNRQNTETDRIEKIYKYLDSLL